ncbi:hypothetical protein HD554DRAFT_2317336 [Boletus coccyginus]|nr:hypothetical protein HD554DRAFT_2317336 [Boletus coccyginus]
MSAQDGSDRQKLSSLDAGGRSNGASQIRPYPVMSSSNSLEDGEIVEGRFPGISPLPLSQESKNPPQPRSSNQVITSMPSSPTAPAAATVEPMTKEELDRAKSLVLDLLGWGVTPEYLVDCGLSPGIVYRIFTDLRLRLPSNLDVLSPPSPHHAAR